MNRRAWIAIGLAGLATFTLVNCGTQTIPNDGSNDGGGGGGGDGDGGGDPFADYVPDPDIYVAVPDPGMLTTVTTDSGRNVEVPLNIVLVLMAEGAARADAEAVAATIGGTIVGQVPDVGLYQVQLSTNTLAALDAAIATVAANASVTSAGYDAVPTLSQECPAESDNRAILQMDQCPFAETEYYQALTMFDIFRPYLQLNRVTVGIVDTGVDPTTGEFDDVDLLFLNNISGPPTDNHPDLHGTATFGIIAADDDGNGVNGIASRFLQDDLHMVAGAFTTTASAIAYTTMACMAGADVVNLSLETDVASPRFAVIWHAWLRTMGERGDVLFIAAAGNDGRTLNGVNSAPGGIDLPNVLTVASTARCAPDSLAGFSNRGSPVDIAAPGDEVPVVASGGLYLPDSGTSFAAPVVTSLAAILKSIEPGLTPRQVARYITERSLPITPETPFGRVTLTNSICQLLIDRNVGDPVQSWIDPMGLGTHGASGLVLSRICPQGITYTIDSYGSHTLRSPEDDIGMGIIGSATSPPTVSIPGNTEDMVFSIGSSTLTEFALGSYPIMRETGPDSVTGSFHEYASLDGGIAISGTLTLDTCRIDQRDPFSGVNPWIVVVSGAFEGVFEVGHFDGSDPSLHDFSGDFSMPMLVTADEDLFDYLEATCEGGLPREEGGGGAGEAEE